MSRRSTVERVFTLVSDTISPPGTGLLDPEDGIVYAPKSAVICAHGGGNIEMELTSNGVPFLHVHVPSNTCEQIHFPDGLELTSGSGIEALLPANDGSVTLYYCKYDENPGISKVASRAQSFQNVTTVRTPNQFGDQAKT